MQAFHRPSMQLSKTKVQSNGLKEQTLYIRDASGNILATYEVVNVKQFNPGEPPGNRPPIGAEYSRRLKETAIYGSSRLGMKQYLNALWQVYAPITTPPDSLSEGLVLENRVDWYSVSDRGGKYYEHSNHLGNVLAVVTDKKLYEATSFSYSAQVVSATDYFPFGWSVPDRSFSADVYRFGFNGKENDREYGSQLVQDYGFRIYNPSIGKFLSVDPLSPEYPELTPYQFASNTPIQAIDLDGLEAYYLSDGTWAGQVGDDNTVIMIESASAIGQNIQTHIAQANVSPRSARWLLRAGTDLGMDHNTFQDFAGALYQETSGSGVVTSTEAAAMYSVLENRANIPGHGTVHDELIEPGQVNGYANYQNNATIVSALNNEEGVPAYAQNKMNTVREGIIQAIVSDNDYSDGAYFWDGEDFGQVGSGAYNLRYASGYNFTEAGHDLHNLGDNPVDPAEKKPYTYKYESVGTEARTTFSKLTYEWRNAAKPNGVANELGE